MLHKFIKVYLGSTIPYGFYCGYTSKNIYLVPVRDDIKESLYSTKIFSGIFCGLACPIMIPGSMFTIVERLERRMRNIEDTDTESNYIY